MVHLRHAHTVGVGNMGVDYYMVNGDKKIYVGRNISMYMMDDYKKIFDDVYEYCDGEKERQYIDKKVSDLSVSDIHDIVEDHDILSNFTILMMHSRLFAFLLEHACDYDDWELKSDVE